MIGKQAGKPIAGNRHDGFEEAGAGNRLTARLLRHSQRKPGATARPHLRSMAPVLDPPNPWGIFNSRFGDFYLVANTYSWMRSLIRQQGFDLLKCLLEGAWISSRVQSWASHSHLDLSAVDSYAMPGLRAPGPSLVC